MDSLFIGLQKNYQKLNRLLTNFPCVIHGTSLVSYIVSSTDLKHIHKSILKAAGRVSIWITLSKSRSASHLCHTTLERACASTGKSKCEWVLIAWRSWLGGDGHHRRCTIWTKKEGRKKKIKADMIKKQNIPSRNFEMALQFYLARFLYFSYGLYLSSIRSCRLS